MRWRPMIPSLLAVGWVALACGRSEGERCEPAPAVEVDPDPDERAEPAPPRVEGPRLRVLGIAQDGGLPHAACDCPRCDAARSDPRRASPVASLAVIGAAPGQVWLVDASPDLPAQLDALADVRELDPGRVDRRPVAGVLLTHAHMGHYLGLAFLGFEAVSAEAVPVHGSARMVEFLRGNAPWDQLVELENIAPAVAEPGVAFELAPGLRAEAQVVPHRGEYTDTLAWYLEGERERALYLPDTDPWPKWSEELDEVLAGVDLLLVDGTFYSGDELPGRDLSAIGHPLMVDTMDAMQARVDAGLELCFVHLNHSNPALTPGSAARRELEGRGFRVASVGEEFPL